MFLHRWLPALLFLYALSIGNAVAHGGPHSPAPDGAARESAASISDAEERASVAPAIPSWSVSCPGRDGGECCRGKPTVCSGQAKAFLLSRPAWGAVVLAQAGFSADRYRDVAFPPRLPTSFPPRAPPLES